MASEKSLKKALDLLTMARVEVLGAARRPVAWLRSILASRNVVGVGIAEKVTRKRPTGKLALTFYVEKKIAPARLRGDRMIPPALPEPISGPEAIPTDVVALGRLRPEKNATRRPVQPGNSIGHVDITAGTLGAVVTDGRRPLLLSNSHVLALSGTARKGDRIVYPGAGDGGKAPRDVVATLWTFKPFATGGAFVNLADCATARPLPARLDDLRVAIKGVGVPAGLGP